MLLNVEFETLSARIKLRDIEVRVIPGGAEEIVIGKSEMRRLRIPSLESTLDKVALGHDSSHLLMENDVQKKVMEDQPKPKTDVGAAINKVRDSSQGSDDEQATQETKCFSTLLLEDDVTKKVPEDQAAEFRTDVEAAKSKVNDSRCSHSQGSDHAQVE